MRADAALLPLAGLALFAPIAASAQAGAGIDYTLTEDGAPTAKPWEKPALLTGTIDRDGKDYVEVHLNGELQFDLLDDDERDGPTRTLTFGPSVSWDRSTREKKEQDELKLGAVLRYFEDVNLGEVDPDSNPLMWAAQFNADYSRSAVYPDLAETPCDTAAANPFCEVQHKEALKLKLSVFPYLASFEDLLSEKGGAYSFRPQIQFAHEEILDGTLDAATLTKVTGGYTSVLLGAGLNVRPAFISPMFEINATAQLRHRIGVSDSRMDLIERSAERFELSATYYFLQDDLNKETKNWRVGLSVTWTEGSDPFEEKPDASTITFGLRLGRF